MSVRLVLNDNISPKFVRTVTPITPLQALPSYVLTIYFNIILPSPFGFQTFFLPSDFSIENLFCRIRATCPAYLDLLDLFTLITSGDQYKS